MRSEEEKASRKIKEEKQNKEYKEYYVNSLDEIKTCAKCEKPKKLREFVSNYNHRNICKECHKNKTSTWRNDNVDKVIQYKRNSFEKSANHIKSFKENQKCTHCKNEFPHYVLDFHHMRDKEVNISQLYEKDPNRVEEEVKKCELICANCHREETFRNLKSIDVCGNRIFKPEIIEVPIHDGCLIIKCKSCNVDKNSENFTLLKTGKHHSYCKKCLRNKNIAYSKDRIRNNKTTEFINNYKSDHECMDCGHKYDYWITDFDHVDGVKVLNINKMKRHSLENVKNEIEKCELVCANCHRVRTWNRKRSSKTINRSVEINNNVDPRIINEFKVKNSNIENAKEFLSKFHYAGFGRPASIIFEANFENQIIAIAKFAPVVRIEAAKSLGLNPSDVLELDRMCIHPQFQAKNLASKFLASVVKLVKNQTSAKHLISFADSGQGHRGTVYLAANWKEVSASSSSYYYIDELGTRFNKKSIYNRATKLHMKESEYVSSLGLQKVGTPGKYKFIYEL